MELTSAPARPGPDAPRHCPVTIPQSAPWIRGMREMVSLLIAALAGALATGVLATLIMMSAPAYAGSPPESHAPANPQLLVRLPRKADEADPHAARVFPKDLAPLPGPQALTSPPVCTCTLPPAVD